MLHLLPHPGGGGETYLELIRDMEGWRHVREILSESRSPARAAAAVLERGRSLRHAASAHDLVHVHGDAAVLLSAPILRGRAVVMTTHGLHLLRRSDGLRGLVVRAALGRALRRCRRVICTSQAERDELNALYGRALDGNLVVVRNGIDLPARPAEDARESVRAELGLEPGDVVVLYLGQLEQRKDPLTAVAAAEQAAADGAPVRLVVAGDGPLMGDARAAAGDACRVLGFRTDPDRLLAAADVFLLPSEREGASFALLEAMGRGLAIVVADSEGNVEVAGDAGVVFALGDAAALRDVLIRLAADSAERERLGAAARRRVADELSRERMVDGVRRAYEGALTAPGRGAAGGSASTGSA